MVSGTHKKTWMHLPRWPRKLAVSHRSGSRVFVPPLASMRTAPPQMAFKMQPPGRARAASLPPSPRSLVARWALGQREVKQSSAKRVCDAWSVVSVDTVTSGFHKANLLDSSSPEHDGSSEDSDSEAMLPPELAQLFDSAIWRHWRLWVNKMFLLHLCRMFLNAWSLKFSPMNLALCTCSYRD